MLIIIKVERLRKVRLNLVAIILTYSMIIIIIIIILFIFLSASSSHSEGDTALLRTGIFFGGLFQDIKRRGKFYLSDFSDGFNLHSLFASLFLYFTLFATNIAFGGLLEDKTEGWLGLTEVIVSASASSIILGLFAGQPMMIIGATGPILVFEQSIYDVNIRMMLVC